MTSIASDPQVAHAPLRHAPGQSSVTTGSGAATGKGGAAAPLRMATVRIADPASTQQSSSAAPAGVGGGGTSRLNLVV